MRNVTCYVRVMTTNTNNFDNEFARVREFANNMRDDDANALLNAHVLLLCARRAYHVATRDVERMMCERVARDAQSRIAKFDNEMM